jgi:hypothetical protein
MRLRWTTPATNDLYKIVQHIQQENPVAATDVAATIYDGCDSLRRFPYRGEKDGLSAAASLFFPDCLTSLFIGFKIKSLKSSAFITEPRTGPDVRGQRQHLLIASRMTKVPASPQP